MISASDRWGPFTADLDPAERLARCRCLRAVVHLTAGPRGEEAAHLLRVVERDPAILANAARALNAMAVADKQPRVGILCPPVQAPLRSARDDPAEHNPRQVAPHHRDR